MQCKVTAGLGLTALLIVGCEHPSDEVADQGTLPAASCAIERELVSTLGAEGDPVSVRASHGIYVALASSGQWIVVDYPSDVLTYGTDGLFLGRLGDRGQGPGEWSEPARVTLDESDSVWVSDLRGRAVVFSPVGQATRTIADPELLPIDGFTASNLPYSVRFHPEAEDRTQGSFSARVLDRDGVPLFSVGPGARESRDGNASVPLLVAPATTAVGDSIFAAIGPDLWVARWTTTGEDTVATGYAIRSALEDIGSITELPVLDAEPTGLTTSADDGFWATGAIRRESPEVEEALREEARLARGLPAGSLEIARSVDIRNRVFDGVLLHVTRQGAVMTATIFDEVPWGFVSGSPYHFTIVSEDSGLLKVLIWRSELECS
jgi:hypothetical protein